MTKLLVVFGATGQQGGSVIDTVLNTPSLSAEYTLRGITRDASTPLAQALTAKGVEVVSADYNDPASLKHALHGAHTVFIVTVTLYEDPTTAYAKELAQGKAITDAAVAAGAKYIIASSGPHIGRETGGKLDKCWAFDAKADMESYIRSLTKVQSAFFYPGGFMQNFHGLQKPRPVEGSPRTYVLSNVMKPETKLPCIDVTETGKWVGAILSEPEKYAGKYLCAATRCYSLAEIVDIMSKVTGKTIIYQEIPDEVFKSHLPPAIAEGYVQIFQYYRDYGYFGADMEEKVEWAAKQGLGKLTTLEEFFAKNPARLE